MAFKEINSTELHHRVFRELQKGISTNIPGHILAFDSGSQTAQVQIGVSIRVKGEQVRHQPLIHVPVYFFGGDEYFVEVQIDPGTEGMIAFAQRCIDGWVNTGGVGNNPILRLHSLDDAMFFPGLRSQPKKISNFNNNGIRLRDKSGQNYFWLKNDGSAEIKANSLKIDTSGATEINSSSLTHNGVNVGSDHRHSGVDTGPGTTQGPQ